MSPKNNKSRNTNLNETQKIHHNQILIQENEGKKNSDNKSNPSIVDLKRLMEVVFVIVIDVEPGGSIPSHKVSWQWHGGCGPRLRWRRRLLVVVKGYLFFFFFLVLCLLLVINKKFEWWLVAFLRWDSETAGKRVIEPLEERDWICKYDIV